MQLDFDTTATLVGITAGTLICASRFLVVKTHRKDVKEQTSVDSEPSAPEPVPEPLTDAETAEFEARATRICWRQVRLWHCVGIVAILALVPLAPWLRKGSGDGRATLQQTTLMVPSEMFEAAASVSTRVIDMEEDWYDGNGHAISVNLTRQLMTFHSVGDVIYYKSAYWGELKVGVPAQTYRVVFDTGSGHLLLPSSYCRSETCRAHRRYRRSSSRSAKDIDSDGTVVKPNEPRDQITVSFGTGEVTGVFVEDNVCMEDQKSMSSLPDSSDLCMSLRLVAATEMSHEPFRTFEFDGVAGLGLPGLSQTKEFNFMQVLGDTMAQTGNKYPHRFAVFLGEHEAEVSEITLGGYEPKHAEGRLAWNSVWQPELGHWMLEVKSMHVDGKKVDFCQEGCRAVMDTGTSLVAVPSAAFPEFYELLRHEADPATECHGVGPQLHVELETFTVTLEPRDYARLEHSNGVSPVPEKSFQAAMGQQEEESAMCKPMLMAMDMAEPLGPKLFVLGEPVLRKYYTVYDANLKRPRIGFSKALHTEQPTHLQEDEDDFED
eukprot:CAMPEP_0172810438 /NCGR_PEP_ID=MMETSP1075-20121228/8801_1 /TAXON_ID=2916 /ORGANISM="Ceratium fusus, Strain PA161109" /LENGTH=547 /DNA_ID=CAMNT_0013649751 /DNA_START=68 /DNA_END=1711 /DNA_ORIENTATION=+